MSAFDRPRETDAIDAPVAGRAASPGDPRTLAASSAGLRARLEALAVHLSAHGFQAELTDEGLVVSGPRQGDRSEGGVRAALTITCRPHDGDEGRHWFFTSERRPIAEADRITDALVAVKGLLGTRT
jgi:hypothetical protein